MRTLEEIKEQVPNISGGDTEWFNKIRDQIIMMIDNGYYIPKICSILFHDYSVMSTPDSLGSYCKLILKIKVPRKGKSILLDDEEYQLALDERARLTGSKYMYYSKTARDNKKLNKDYKSIIESNLRREELQRIISTKDFSDEKIKKLELSKKEISDKIRTRFKPEYVLNEIGYRYDATALTKEYTDTIKELNRVINELEIMLSVKNLANVLGTKMDQITIIYNELEDYEDL